jgi:hypothetical protein
MSGCEKKGFIAKFNFDCFLVVLKKSPLVLQRTFCFSLLYGAKSV